MADFSSTISKTSAGVSLGFQTRENISHSFIVFERLKLIFLQRKLVEIIILRSFREFNFILFETWIEGVLSKCLLVCDIISLALNATLLLSCLICDF